MDEIQAIVDEDQLLLISFRDGKWVQSSDWPACKPLVTEPGGTTYVYSWRGTHDRVLNGIPKQLPDAGF